MEFELRLECSKILEIIERLARFEEISDEETAQLIDHIGNCDACKEIIDQVLDKALQTNIQS